ncbi:MAG: MATE family efflux transporter [Hyphomicrobiales bacterium]
MTEAPKNPFLTLGMGALYARTALPIILLLAVHGLISIADAWFLGRFVGPEALAAVTLIFPFFMGVAALSTLVSAGMSSVMARHLGAGAPEKARDLIAGAHGLSLALCVGLVVLFALIGETAVQMVANGDDDLAALALPYLKITVVTAALAFLLSLHARALQNLGRIRFMTMMSLFVSFANIVFNSVFIVGLGLGVAGAAIGTAAAQTIGLAIIYVWGLSHSTRLRIADALDGRMFTAWRSIFALGASPSLGLVSVSIASVSIIAVLQHVASRDYATTVSAYGIVTRLQIFAFVPLLGLSQAMQSITGNNFGAKLHGRVAMSLRFAFCAAFLFGAIVQICLYVFGDQIGFVFVSDPSVAAELGAILPLAFLTFFLTGPLIVIGGHFQAIGNARMSLLLGLSKPYLFVIPLIFALPLVVGEVGVWLAWAAGDILLLALLGVIIDWQRLRPSAHAGRAQAPFGVKGPAASSGVNPTPPRPN